MHVTIKYRLSPQGQKASMLAGGDGKAEQTATVPSDSPHFAAVNGPEHAAARSVRESAEAIAWEAELAEGKRLAEAGAQAERDRIKAEEQAETARKEAARAAWREKYGLESDDIALTVEDGALTSVPAGCWESHKRGKNWLAIITVDPSKPGGLDRDFAAKAKGDSYYLLPSWSPGDAVEFGADYYSGGGRKNPTRWYGFYVRSFNGQNMNGEDRSYVVLRKVAGGKTAVKEGRKFAEEQSARTPDGRNITVESVAVALHTE